MLSRSHLGITKVLRDDVILRFPLSELLISQAGEAARELLTTLLPQHVHLCVSMKPNISVI